MLSLRTSGDPYIMVLAMYESGWDWFTMHCRGIRMFVVFGFAGLLKQPTQTPVLSHINISQQGIENPIRHCSAVRALLPRMTLILSVVSCSPSSSSSSSSSTVFYPAMKRSASFVWSGSSVWASQRVDWEPCAVPHWLASWSKWPKAQRYSFVFFLPPTKCQCLVTASEKAAGKHPDSRSEWWRKVCLLAASSSPLTWSHLNRSRPANSKQQGTCVITWLSQTFTLKAFRTRSLSLLVHYCCLSHQSDEITFRMNVRQ